MRAGAAVAGVVAFVAMAGGASAGDAARGQIVFKQCAACHTVIAGVRNSMGPSLRGVVGRKAGSVAGYPYSDEIKTVGEWTPEKLKAFVMDPQAVVPASNMAFAGISNATQADDLVAYLVSRQ